MKKNLISCFMKNSVIKDKGLYVIHSESEEEFIPYCRIYENACKYLQIFQERNIKKGNEILFLVNDIDRFIYIFWACQLGGITAVPLDVGENDENNIKAFRIWSILNDPFIVTDEENMKTLEGYKEPEYADIIAHMKDRFVDASLPACGGGDCEFHDYLNDDYIALIQFSSGSTGVPKGIPIKYSSLYTHVNALAKREEISENDVTINWAPLSHNLGLVSVHLVSTLFSLNQYMMPKNVFIKNPLIWMDKATEHKATIIYSPNFGYKYILTHSDNIAPDRWDLSNVRIAFNGAEPINYELCMDFVKAMKRFGLHQNVTYPAYGCSESTSVISIPTVGDELLAYPVDRNSLNFGEKVVLKNEENANNCVNLVAVGYPVDDCEVRVCDEKNNPLDDFYIGTLQVRGKNIIDSYYNNEKATKEAFVGDGWFNTGDLCFRDKETIVITGRAKEIIFISGQNYYPYDIERIAEKADECLAGKLAACGVFSEDIQTDEIFIFAEGQYNKSDEELTKLADLIKGYVRDNLGLYIGAVVFPENLEKTESGKLQRLKMGKKYTEGAYDKVYGKAGVIQKDESEKDIRKSVENNLLAIWRETLSNSEIGVDDNFFNVGGSSTLLIVLTSKMEKIYKEYISVIDIFEAPTVRDLTDLIVAQLEKSNKTEKLQGNKLVPAFKNQKNNASEPNTMECIVNTASSDNIAMMGLITQLLSNIVAGDVIAVNMVKDEKVYSKAFDKKELMDVSNLKTVFENMPASEGIAVSSVFKGGEAGQVTVVFATKEMNSIADIFVVISEDKLCFKVNENKVNMDNFTKILGKFEDALSQ